MNAEEHCELAQEWELASRTQMGTPQGDAALRRATVHALIAIALGVNGLRDGVPPQKREDEE